MQKLLKILPFVALFFLIFPRVFTQTMLSATFVDLHQDIGLTLEQFEMMNSLFFLLISGLFIPIGLLCDQVSKKKLIIYSGWLFLIGCVIGSVAKTPTGVLVARALQALATPFSFTAGLTLALEQVSSQAKGRLISYFSVMMTVGFIFGPYIGGLLAHSFGWRAIFAINIPFLLLGLACAFILKTPSIGEKRPFFSGFKELKKADFLLGCFTIALFQIFSSYYLYMPTILQESSLMSASKAGGIVTLTLIPALIVMPIIGHLYDRYGFIPLYIASLFLTTVALVLLKQEILFIGFIFFTIGISLMGTPSVTFSIGGIDQKHRGLAIATNATVRFFGGFVGSKAFGWILDQNRINPIHALQQMNNLSCCLLAFGAFGFVYYLMMRIKRA